LKWRVDNCDTIVALKHTGVPDMQTRVTKKSEKVSARKSNPRIDDGLIILGLEVLSDEPYISADHFASKFKRCTLLKEVYLTYSASTHKEEED